jgi:ABC-type Zn uptake system ZnuABC Zn-binding protein ZnuA
MSTSENPLPNCLNCKYLGSDPVTDTYLRVGDINYWCDNENVIEVPEDLNPDLMEEYPDACESFEAILEA